MHMNMNPSTATPAATSIAAPLASSMFRSQFLELCWRCSYGTLENHWYNVKWKSNQKWQCVACCAILPVSIPLAMLSVPSPLPPLMPATNLFFKVQQVREWFTLYPTLWRELHIPLVRIVIGSTINILECDEGRCTLTSTYQSRTYHPLEFLSDDFLRLNNERFIH